MSVPTEIIPAFSDCSRKISNKGCDVFDTPALALSHPLSEPNEAIEGEKISHSPPDVAEEISHQNSEDKGPDVVPRSVLQVELNKPIVFNPTGNYQLFPLFERTFIDLGTLMVEEGFDLVTYTKVEGLLSEDWRMV